MKSMKAVGLDFIAAFAAIALIVIAFGGEVLCALFVVGLLTLPFFSTGSIFWKVGLCFILLPLVLVICVGVGVLAGRTVPQE